MGISNPHEMTTTGFKSLEPNTLRSFGKIIGKIEMGQGPFQFLLLVLPWMWPK